MSKENPEQGEVWFCDFDPVEGSEQAGFRPALVVSRNEMNRIGRCMVVPGTTQERKWPGRVMVPLGVGGLEKTTWFLCDQLRTVDRRRLRRYVGEVDRKYVLQVLTHVRYFLKDPD